jgi:glycosyltransferase involved in cell wall biosynthesis
LRALSQKFQPDVIEIHTPTVAWVAAWAKLQIPCIHVVQGYGAITRSGSFKDWLMRQGDRLAHRFLNARFIVPAPPMAEVSAGHFAVDFSRFDCVPNCVDVLSFTPRPKLPDEVPSIMMLGTLSHHKGQQWGVKAIAFMQRYFPNVKLLVVGEGTYRPELETLIRDLELEERVELTGRRRDAFEMLADSHVFWHLSESEGLPMVVLEAMASGLPVVGFDVRGTRDVIVDGETGYLVPFGDIEMVVQKTVALLNNEFLYQKMSRNAREHVAGRFSLECMIVGHESVLHSAKTDVR